MRIDDVKTGARPKRANKKGQGRKLSYDCSLDEKILQWLLEKREQEIAVSVIMLLAYAKALICPVLSSFKASDGWAYRFMKRHQLGA